MTRRRRRDSRGRGLRGPLVPVGVPLGLSRAEQFDELVRTAVSRLQHRWAEQLDSVEVVVEEVPDERTAGPVALGSVQSAGARPARIVVYRRPVEARARGQRAREALVHEVVVERLAELLGVDPASIDPDVGD